MILQSYLDELTDAANARIVDVVSEFLPLKAQGREFAACCPFHDEKTPSFHVVPAKGMFYCQGCGEGGGALKFVMEYSRAPFPEVVATVAKTIGFRDPEFEPRNRTASEDEALLRQRELKTILNAASAYFSNRLANDQAGIAMALGRHLTPGDVETFSIGFAGPGPADLVRHLQTSFDTPAIVDSGVASQKEGERGMQTWDFYRDRLIFPVRNLSGDVVTFGGRTRLSHGPSGKRISKYLNGRETEIFKKSDELYGLFEASRARTPKDKAFNVVEGYLDVVASHRAGITNTVAPMGTNITASQLQRLFARTDEIRFVFDGDEAGTRAALKAIERSFPIITATKRVSIVLLPPGEDPDSLICNERTDEYRAALDAALSPSEFLAHYTRSEFGTTPESKAQGAQLINELIGLLEDQELQLAYKSHFYDTMGIRPASGLAASGDDSTPVPETDYMSRMPSRSQAFLNAVPGTTRRFCGAVIAEPRWANLINDFPEAASNGTRLLQFVLTNLADSERLLGESEGSDKGLLFKQLWSERSTDPTLLFDVIDKVNSLTLGPAEDPVLSEHHVSM